MSITYVNKKNKVNRFIFNDCEKANVNRVVPVMFEDLGGSFSFQCRMVGWK